MDFAVLTVKDSDERFVQARIPGTSADVSIGGDGAQVFRGSEELFWSEYWDYDTPDDLLDRLCARIAELRA